MGCEVEDSGAGLPPLEFTECLADSPQFRDKLQRHEKELERTSQQIKRLIKEVKDVVSAARRLGSAQLALASSMEQFEFACIGASMTEDERAISHSLRHFATLIRTVEDERDRMLGRAHDQIIAPLEKFRKEHIGAVKEGKKKFDKKTAKFCQTQERTLSLSTKKPETIFQEADAALEMASRDFYAASAEYVCALQEVHERKKFELVETLLSFVFSWWTFHHTAHDVHADAEPLVRDLQLRIQRTRSNFEETSKHTESLMKKMMEARQMVKEEEMSQSECGGDAAGSPQITKAGYLFMFEKKAFGATWSKQYAVYTRHNRTLTLTPFNQINVKISAPAESLVVSSARAVHEPERRWCWEAGGASGAGGAGGAGGGGGDAALLLQSVSAADRAAWLRTVCSAAPTTHTSQLEEAPGYSLDDAGFNFVKQIIAEIEARGLQEQGLYRIAGVASKVSRLLQCAAGSGSGLGAAGAGPGAAGAGPGAAGAALGAGALSDAGVWDTRTLTSALKAFLRSLPDGLVTRRLHSAFVNAAKLESRSERQAALSSLVSALPPRNRDMLCLVTRHLRRVASYTEHNKMCASNLAVCFGPTLLKPPRETVAEIMDIKFYNVCVEALIQHPTLFRDNYHHYKPSPMTSAAPVTTRNDMSVVERVGSCASLGAPPSLGAPTAPARYSPQHHQLLQQFPPHARTMFAPNMRVGPARSSSSSAESSSRGASPPLLGAGAPGAGVGAPGAGGRRVRTLYACVAEAEGELSFEANQIITDVRPSPEPGWLRGSLAGRCGLVPSNYVEPLP